MNKKPTRTLSGKPLEELTLENVLSGELGAEDIRISREMLIYQAEAAEAAGYLPLGQNFRRAAELTALSNREVFDFYELLRPGRASYEELLDLADRLEQEREAPLNAELIRHAAEAYSKRGLLKSK